jgi:hypothetical protein
MKRILVDYYFSMLTQMSRVLVSCALLYAPSCYCLHLSASQLNELSHDVDAEIRTINFDTEAMPGQKNSSSLDYEPAESLFMTNRSSFRIGNSTTPSAQGMLSHIDAEIWNMEPEDLWNYLEQSRKSNSSLDEPGALVFMTDRSAFPAANSSIPFVQDLSILPLSPYKLFCICACLTFILLGCYFFLGKAAQAPAGQMALFNGMTGDEGKLQHYILWELERYTLFHGTWGPPCLPTDGVRRMKWVGMTAKGSYVQHPWAPKEVRYSEYSSQDGPPLKRVNFLNKLREVQWRHVTTSVGKDGKLQLFASNEEKLEDGQITHLSGPTDEDGWQYASGFDLGFSGWQPNANRAGIMAMPIVVRRRCWIPHFTGQFSEVASNKIAVEKPTTHVEQKGVSVSKPQVLFEEEIGEISLEKLAKALQSKDPWEADPNGGLMANYFARIQASNMEVGPWAEDASVQGKTRSVNYVKPLPPKPMCPPESRIQSIVHIFCSQEKVVLEQSVMTLDTPAQAMNLWIIDTFSVESRKMKLKRECAFEWVSSSWLKVFIESQTPASVQESVPEMVETIQAWARK